MFKLRNTKSRILYTWVKVQYFQNPDRKKSQIMKLTICLQNINNFKLNGLLSLVNWKSIREAIIAYWTQHFEADFLWEASLKILNSGVILKMFTLV